MKFLKTLQSAIYSPDYVARFKNKTFWGVFWIICTLCLLKIVIIMVIAIPQLVGPFTAFTSGGFIADHFPEGLEVNIINGQVSTNVEEPYYIPNTGAEGDEPKNLLVIDTGVENTLSALEEYDTAILVTKTDVAAAKSEGEVRVFSLDEVTELHITEETTLSFLQKIKPILYVIVVMGIILLPIFVMFFIAAGYCILLLPLALLTLLVGKMRKVSLTYSEAYVLSGYLLVFPVLVNIVVSLFVPGSVLLTVAVFAAMVLLNVRGIRNVPGVSV